MFVAPPAKNENKGKQNLVRIVGNYGMLLGTNKGKPNLVKIVGNYGILLGTPLYRFCYKDAEHMPFSI